MNALHINAVREKPNAALLIAREERVEELECRAVHLSEVATAERATAMMVHEVSQPVTAAINYLATAEKLMLIDSCLSHVQGLDAVRHAQHCLERTGSLLRSVRDVAAERPPHALPHDLAEIVADVMEMFTGENDIATEIEISPNASRVMGDGVQIGQVLSNLVRNAREATEGQGTRRLRIVSRTFTDERVEVRVEDNGPGIPLATQMRLFSPLPSTKLSGAGIGLSICSAIIKQHQGLIWMVPLKQGSAFCFTLRAPAID